MFDLNKTIAHLISTHLYESVFQLAERVDACFYMMTKSKITGDPENSVNITMEQFKQLIWHLLGLEPDLLPDSLFSQYEITLDFIRRNLPKLFHRAVIENAPDLLQS